jgi:hypothetical protein
MYLVLILRFNCMFGSIHLFYVTIWFFTFKSFKLIIYVTKINFSHTFLLYFVLKEYLFDMYPSYQCLSVGYSHHQSYMLDSEEKVYRHNLWHIFKLIFITEMLNTANFLFTIISRMMWQLIINRISFNSFTLF